MSNLKLVLELDDESEIEITLEQAEVLYKELKTIFGHKDTSPLTIPLDPFKPIGDPWSTGNPWGATCSGGIFGSGIDITSFDPITSNSGTISLSISDSADGAVTLKAVT